MLFSRLSIFKQKQPKSFTYTPRYYNEEEELQQGSTSEARIRQAFGSIERAEKRTYREKMDERRLMGSYDTHAARKKTIYLLALLAVIAVLWFWLN
jgi:hypothetical protein